MKKILCMMLAIMLISSMALTGCGNKKGIEKKASSENELQSGKGINGKLPDIKYSYEAIADAPGGICPQPSVYKDNYSDNMNQWRKNAQKELKKISHKLDEDASDKEIARLFKQLLYIGAYDYEPIEPIERFSYVIFKNDGKDQFTHRKIRENANVNVEIVLDCSGSMAKRINGESMMNIAKSSIGKVLSEMPANANVGVRVFGHKGDNSNAKKEESCNANELIHPIKKLDVQGIESDLASLKPTGWTSISKSIEEGTKDLSKFKGKKNLNILYIVTDGIETCGENPATVAKRLKNEKTDIVLGIVGFNVDATQDNVLKEIAKAGGGYYSSARDADKLTSELQRIHELSYTNYKGELLDDNMIMRVSGRQEAGLTHNRIRSERGPIVEKNALNTLIMYGGTSSNDSGEYAGLYQKNGVVAQKLKKLAEKRYKKISKILEVENTKREKESKEYIESIKARKGEFVYYIPSTSRLDPQSKYWTGFSSTGGNLKDIEKEGKALDKQERAKQTQQK